MSSQLSPPTEQEFQAMVKSMEQLHLCNYVTGMQVIYTEPWTYMQFPASMLAFILYDIIINLEQEVGHSVML